MFRLSLTQHLVICDDCKRQIPWDHAIQQSGLIFCESKDECRNHISMSGGRGCRQKKVCNTTTRATVTTTVT